MTSKPVTGIRIDKDGKVKVVKAKPRSVSDAIRQRNSKKVKAVPRTTK